MSTVRNRKRPSGLTVMLTVEERREMQKAADEAGLALSVFIRLLAINAVKRGETVGTAKAA